MMEAVTLLMLIIMVAMLPAVWIKYDQAEAQRRDLKAGSVSESPNQSPTPTETKQKAKS